MTDNLRRIALDGIERHCGWLKVSSGEIIHFVEMLEFRRPYTTDVETMMAEANSALAEAMAKLTRAQQAYFGLRKES